ncbi:unnamed protein product [Rhodiola kirilowii]
MALPFTLLLLILTISISATVHGQTRVGFYATTCPRAESIIKSTVQTHFSSDPSIAPGLLRMHFHDCFVRGCDASLLLDGSNAEKTSPPNLSVRGYEVINDAKSQLEAACPGVVSCADIITVATRDAVVMSGGLSWTVPTGRRDGTVSLASEVNLPGPTDSIESQLKTFTDKGLTAQDLVTLVGGHTIGTTQCQFFSYRLYNFSTLTSTGADPALDPTFVTALRTLCPQNGDGTKRVALDTGSQNRFDTSFYANLRSGKGVLESDQMLWSDTTMKPFVQRYLGIRGLLGLNFGVEFGRAMVKMGNIGVKTGTTQGEIRKVCSAIN